MLEIILDITNSPTWYAVYISVLLGLSVQLVWGVVLESTFLKKLSSHKDPYFPIQKEPTDLNVFTLLDWIAKVTKRKECPADDSEDHHSFSNACIHKSRRSINEKTITLFSRHHKRNLFTVRVSGAS